MNLYKVTIKGGYSTGSTNYHTSYVVAENPDDAYKKVRCFLDAKDICFKKDRALHSVELKAEDTNYPECGTLLFV
jgi:hypothetical protein